MSGTERASSASRARAAGAGPAAARSLADDLRRRDDEQLAALLRTRPDLVHPVPADLGVLATRATTSASVTRALDRLDLGALQVAEGLAALPEPTRRRDLARGLPGMSTPYLKATLARLRAEALLWGDDDDLHLVRLVRQGFGDYPAGLGPEMAQGRRGVAAYAKDPDLVQRTLADAPPEASEVIELLTWQSPVGRLENADRVVTVDTAATAVEWLLARHLFEPLDESTVVLPREVALALRGGVLVRDVQPGPPPVAARAVREPALVDATAGQQAYRFVRAVDDLLQAWSLAPPPVLRAGGLGVRELARTAGALDLDESQTAVVVETAYAAGLLAADGEVGEAWCPTPAYDVWLTRPTGEQWALLALAWLATTRTPALTNGRDATGVRTNVLARDLDRPGAPDARRGTLEALAAQPAGVYPDPADLATLQQWRRPRRQTPLRLLVSAATLPEAEQLGVTGLGALSSHGRALLDAPVPDDSSAEARASARMPGRTPVPEAVVAALTPFLPTPLDHVLLQADLTAVAPGPLEPGLAAQLALLADVESTGGATVYRFGEGSVRRALDAGHSASDVLAMLQRHSRTPVPQPLSYLVTDVARRHGAVRVGVASAYVRCDDPATIAAMLVDRRLAPLRLSRLADTVLASQAAPDEVLAGLREAGLAPSAETPDGTVVIRAPQSRRTPPRPRPPHLSADPPPATAALITAAIRALRAGEHAAANRPEALFEGDGSGRLGRSTTGETLDALHTALEGGTSVWIGYADPTGTTTERVVEPLRLDGGFLTAYDLRTAEVRTFTVARITAVAPVADTR
ncbi:MAG: helicase C-terminal domain-containing protein [Candidatus Nanopelagicales bacterium]